MARDLESTRDYISQENPALPKGSSNRSAMRPETLSIFQASAVGGDGVTDTRELIVSSTPFIIVYRVGDDRIEILAVFHGARRWPESFDVPE